MDNNFEFTTLARGKFGSSIAIPNGIVRVGKKYITFAEDILSNFTTTKQVTATGHTTVKVSLAIDLRHQAIQIKEAVDTADVMNAFTVKMFDSGAGGLGIPVAFAKVGLPTGDYVRSASNPNVFQLAR